MFSAWSNLKGMPWGGQNNAATPTKHKTDVKLEPLQALLGNEPPRQDGSDRFFGFENVVGVRPDQPFGNTCYCNSILQCLYFSRPFRENVVNFPQRGQLSYQTDLTLDGDPNSPGGPTRPGIPRIHTEPLPTTSAAALAAAKAKALASPAGQDGKRKSSQTQVPLTGPENKESSEYKKKKAIENGPILDIDQGNADAYGMDESLFSALKDIFESVMAHGSRSGIIRPNRFLEILRQGNEMYGGQQHQDAHEFLNYVLNEVKENVDGYHKKNGLKNNGGLNGISTSSKAQGIATPPNESSTASTASMPMGASNSWIHELFGGLLTSETKCLTCENVSRRDEPFLDLSIDLETNSSVTSCLRSFSASEMLRERNKFHCDGCGGLQEAEKRMKIKRLPKVLALHLKRFKYMEQLGRFEKLHHRVMYPNNLRLFNTTDDAEDQDRLYELYAVVVHIGGGPYHGHYVAVIKTEDKGWMLFDDELVEPVHEDYVRTFFGDRNGTNLATAYLLFYQETTLDAYHTELWADDLKEAESTPVPDSTANEPVKEKESRGSGWKKLGLNGSNGHAVKPGDAGAEPAARASITSPVPLGESTNGAGNLEPSPIKSRKEKEKDKKDDKEKKDKKGEKEKEKEKDKDKPNGFVPHGGMSRFKNTSKSLSKKPKWLGSLRDDKKEKEPKDKEKVPQNTISEDDVPPLPKSPLFSPRVIPTLSDHEKENLPTSPVRAPTAPASIPTADKKEKKTAKEHKKDKKEEKKKDEEKKEGRKMHSHKTSIFGLRKRASAIGVTD